MTNPLAVTKQFLDHSSVNFVAFVILEIIVEGLYRRGVGSIWRHLCLKTNVSIDAWLGEICFFSAAVTIITIFHYNKQRFLYLYQGYAITILTDSSLGIAFGCILCTIQFMLLQHFGWHAFQAGSTYVFPLVNEVFFCLSVGITEETAFRGYLFPMLKQKQGVGTAVLATSVLFAFGHLSNPHALDSVINTFYTLAITFSSGLLFALCIILTGRIWLSIGVHFSMDFLHNLLYGDGSTGVYALSMAEFVPVRVGQSSIFICAVCDVILLIITIKRGKWTKFSNASRSIDTVHLTS